MDRIETRSDPPVDPATGNDAPDLAAAVAAVGELRAAVETRTAETETRLASELRAITQRLDTLDVRTQRPGAGGAQPDEQTQIERRAFGTYLRHGREALSDVERRALTVGADATAGFLAPTSFGDEILKALREASPIRQFAKVVRISARDVRYPRQTGNTAATWVDEVGARTESAPSYEQVVLTPAELATFVEVSRQLLEDAAYPLESELAGDLGESFAIAEGSAFVAGNGTGKPKGILAATGITEVLSGTAATLGATPADKMIDLFASLKTAHAQNAAWMMNRTTLAALRKLKDAQGAYLWQPSLQAGAPSTLLGRPVIEAVDMPDVAAGAYPIIFGDWSGYRIIDRVDVSVLTDPFTKARNGIVTYHARKRVGGDVTNPDRFVKLKIGTA